MKTSRLIQGVAESTLQRDRGQIDLATVRLLSHFFHANVVTLFHLLNDNGTQRLVTRAARRREGGEEVPEMPADPSTLPAIAEIPVCHECVTLDRIVEAVAENGRLLTAFPLHSKLSVLGSIVVESDASLPVPQIELIHGILRILESHVALLDYGERDTLTGLLNRKTFEGHFERIRERAAGRGIVRTGVAPSWLALVDIDHFKLINDRHGHIFGDEVLLLVSQIMTHNFRGTDQIYRFGGEEFVIVLDCATEAGAHVALERLRASIEAHEFPQVGRVTISLGYTQINRDDACTNCMERADNALYFAKGHGRNSVQNFEALVASGGLIAKAGTSSIELF